MFQGFRRSELALALVPHHRDAVGAEAVELHQGGAPLNGRWGDWRHAVDTEVQVGVHLYLDPCQAGAR